MRVPRVEAALSVDGAGDLDGVRDMRVRGCRSVVVKDEAHNFPTGGGLDEREAVGASGDVGSFGEFPPHASLGSAVITEDFHISRHLGHGHRSCRMIELLSVEEIGKSLGLRLALMHESDAGLLMKA